MKIALPYTTTIYFISAALSCFLILVQAQYSPQYQQSSESRIYAYRNYLQQYLCTRRSNCPYYTTPRPRQVATKTNKQTPKPSQKFEIPRQSNSRRKKPKTTTTTAKPVVVSPATRLAKIIRKNGGTCGARTSNYLPHTKRKGRSSRRISKEERKQQPRRGRVVWEDDDSMGAGPSPRGTFPWMVSLFVLLKNGEALFMCAGTLLTPNIAVTAAHCFTNNEKQTTWFARVGDNYILRSDPEEQTFRVSKIVKHGNFKPLGSGKDGDGRHDIALVIFQPHRSARDLYGNSNQEEGLAKYGKDVKPICVLPQSDYPLNKLTGLHCEIAGWGMTEYNNSNSYPDSVRAARITVGDVSDSFCNYLYKRNVHKTGKFCAGYGVDACQEDSGGPLVCRMNGKYNLVGIVSSGKGCGIYPGLYTDVSRYMDWLAYWVEKESV